MFDCFGVRFVPPILEKKPNFQNGQKSRNNGTNMDIILSFLAKSVDKHSITPVHITYPPLIFPAHSKELYPIYCFPGCLFVVVCYQFSLMLPNAPLLKLT